MGSMPIAGRRLNHFEGRQLLGNLESGLLSADSTPITFTTTDSITAYTPLTITYSTPNPSADRVYTIFSSDFVSTSSTTLSGSTLTNHSTSTQIYGYKIPVIIVVACISTAVILTTAIIFIIRRSRKIQHVRTGEAQSIVLGIDTPPPSPTRAGAPHEHQPSSSDDVNRSRDQRPSFNSHLQRRQKTRFSRARQINSPAGSFPQVMEQLSRRGLPVVSAGRSAEMEQQMTALHAHVQQLTGQVEHLQRQLIQTDRDQDPDDEEPPVYSQL